MEAVRAHFRPEFLNRLDETIIFDRLSREEMDGIVEIQLRLLQERLQQQRVSIELDDLAVTWLADQGFDTVYGARPLKRVIQRNLQNPLAELLLSGEISEGSQINISANPSGLVIGDFAQEQLGQNASGPDITLH